ncbi:hypothetical protein BH10ACT9_BH10ACT9_14730 [soil metagenome]
MNIVSLLSKSITRYYDGNGATSGDVAYVMFMPDVCELEGELST